MSKNRRDIEKAKRRRDRIRREKHAERFGTPPERDLASDPPIHHRFAMERSLRQVQVLLEGDESEDIGKVNERLAELTGDGRLAEKANAWKQDDPKWRAQELAYKAMETDSLEEALLLVREAQKLDPDCTDAHRLMASILPMELDDQIVLMREVVEKAERNFGEDFFTENMGHFWGNVFTRPYMRAKRYLAELLTESGALEEAITVFERMLELNPDDNQAVRYALAGLYLATGQPETTNDFMSRYPDEEKFSAVFAWARVLERWLAGNLAEAEAALTPARKVNPFVEKYLTGARKLSSEEPTYHRPGDDAGAQVCMMDLEVACKNHPAFRKWLREHSAA